MAELTYIFAMVLEKEIIEIQEIASVELLYTNKQLFSKVEMNSDEYLMSRESTSPLATKWPS